MQAPGFRMNEREANPNHYIGFIRSLRNKADHTDADMILKAVAAQMKKVMEHRFMFIHTLEEAAYNRVFAGRNWNHGQTVELVLRGKSGRFLPIPYIVSVMCHEMAHIEQMNHGPKFQKLMREIKDEVRDMQARGYYGDGFWSDGRRVKDSVRMGAEGLRPNDFPEYVCGVSAFDARQARRPRRPRSQHSGLVQGEASHRSGRQTEYNRKAGRRNNVDMGQAGERLDGQREITREDREERKEWIDRRAAELSASGVPTKTAKIRAGKEWDHLNPGWNQGSTRGKVAKSKTAAELRAAAAERRLRGESVVKDEMDIKPFLDIFDPEDEVEDPHIAPEERRKQMEEEMSEDERKGLRGGWEEFFTPRTSQIAGSSSKRHSSGVKRKHSPDIDVKGLSKRGLIDARNARKFGPSSKQVKLEQDTTATSNRAVTGGRKLGTETGSTATTKDVGTKPDVDGSRWTCKLCTFSNHKDQGRCAMCAARPDGVMPDDVII